MSTAIIPLNIMKCALRLLAVITISNTQGYLLGYVCKSEFVCMRE